MCYFQYLEANKFIGFKEGKTFESYLYGQALENSSADYDEAILILLEMLRVFFPAGEPIAEAWSHEGFGKSYAEKAADDKDKASIRLLSRIFSLIKADLGPRAAPYLLKASQLDFDLALFSSYTN